ncbi:hypothetical protein EYF80_021784 [Liparis tanakae]|uniref:Uncharacterized protein n=1 Tax=Liparis tanakae TaxID=230148 RepID=A0A4Z2HT23_9TELE|nr:hypothetical protein EYF80_021784 [Liparis tanakae]
MMDRHFSSGGAAHTGWENSGASSLMFAILTRTVAVPEHACVGVNNRKLTVRQKVFHLSAFGLISISCVELVDRRSGGALRGHDGEAEALVRLQALPTHSATLTQRMQQLSVSSRKGSVSLSSLLLIVISPLSRPTVTGELSGWTSS